MHIPGRRLIDINELSEITGRSIRSLYNDIAAGKLIPIKIGRLTRFDAAALPLPERPPPAPVAPQRVAADPVAAPQGAGEQAAIAHAALADTILRACRPRLAHRMSDVPCPCRSAEGDAAWGSLTRRERLLLGAATGIVHADSQGVRLLALAAVTEFRCAAGHVHRQHSASCLCPWSPQGNVVLRFDGLGAQRNPCRCALAPPRVMVAALDGHGLAPKRLTAELPCPGDAPDADMAIVPADTRAPSDHYLEFAARETWDGSAALRRAYRRFGTFLDRIRAALARPASQQGAADDA